MTKKRKLLAIDIGNTNIVIALFEAENLKETIRLSTSLNRTVDEIDLSIRYSFLSKGIDINSIDDVAIASVAPIHNPVFCQFAKRITGRSPLFISSEINMSLTIKYKNRSELGADRIANAEGALNYTDPPFIVVDFGTAITIDIVDKDRQYLGGAITPGIELSIGMLSRKTAKLPEVEFEKPESIIGQDSDMAIKAGLFFGYLDLVDGIVNRMIKSLNQGKVKVIATGGNGTIIAQHSKTIESFRPNLTMEGIKTLFEKNSR